MKKTPATLALVVVLIAGIAVVVILVARSAGKRPRGRKGPLPPELADAFEVPTGKEDEHGNPIRKGIDKKTGWPCEIRHKATGMHFVLIPAGEFLMGSAAGERDRGDDETPHQVRLTKPFYIGKYEATQGEWEEVTGERPWGDREDVQSGPSHPASCISWDDCQEFIQKLEEMSLCSDALDRRTLRKVARRFEKHAALWAEGRLRKRGEELSRNLASRIEHDIASYNLTNASETLKQTVRRDPDLEYAILMDMERTAYLHTGAPELEQETLEGPQDVFAAKQTAMTVNEFEESGRPYLEFIVPIRLGTEQWGSLRLGAPRDSAGPDLRTDDLGSRPSPRQALAAGRKYLLLVAKDGIRKYGKALSASLKRRVESDIASFNFTNASETLKQTVKREPDLEYAILMDRERTAHVHTSAAELEQERLEGPQDVFAAKQTAMAVNEFEKSGRPYIELVVPIHVGTEQWGMLRLVFSLGSANRDIARLSTEIARELRHDGAARGLCFALPTEAQWEYVCRAREATAYSFGDTDADLAEYAWYARREDDTGEGHARAVGQKEPNAWGLYDMHGNVLEWCQDHYDAYGAGNMTDPEGPASGQSRVVRGGGWDLTAGHCRSACRGYRSSDHRSPHLGCRLSLRPLSAGDTGSGLSGR